MPLLLADRAVVAAPVALVTARDAARAGIRPSPHLHHRVRPGVYTMRSAWEALAPWQRYATRVHAFLLVSPDAVLCLESAAVIHGIPLFGETAHIHILSPAPRGGHRFGDVIVHTHRDGREIDRFAGIRATGLVDTAVDLARLVPPAQALSVADAVISRAQGGPLHLDELRDRAAGQEDRRGRARLRWVWDRANGLSESPAESVSRAVIEWTGYEEPELQPVFHSEGCTDRADFRFPSTDAVGESDGWGKYDLDDPEKARAHLMREKRREDRLRRGGHTVARWELGDAMRVQPLCRALQQAGVRPVRPPEPALLTTLRQTPRALPPAPVGHPPPAR